MFLSIIFFFFHSTFVSLFYFLFFTRLIRIFRKSTERRCGIYTWTYNVGHVVFTMDASMSDHKIARIYIYQRKKLYTFINKKLYTFLCHFCFVMDLIISSSPINASHLLTKGVPTRFDLVCEAQEPFIEKKKKNF